MPQPLHRATNLMHPEARVIRHYRGHVPVGESRARWHGCFGAGGIFAQSKLSRFPGRLFFDTRSTRC